MISAATGSALGNAFPLCNCPSVAIGLNTGSDRLIALNTGPRFVGRPMEYKTHVRSAKVGLSGEYMGRAYPCSRVFNRPGSKPRTNTGESRTMIKILGVSAALITGSIAPTYASCTQAQLAGTWTAQSVFQNNAGYLSWSTCTLTINTAGAFSAKTSGCLNSLGQRSTTFGSIRLFSAPTCAYDGTLDLLGYGTTAYIRNVTLSIDHQSAAGIGGGGAYGGVFVFNMVKIK